MAQQEVSCSTFYGKNVTLEKKVGSERERSLNTGRQYDCSSFDLGIIPRAYWDSSSRSDLQSLATTSACFSIRAT